MAGVEDAFCTGLLRCRNGVAVLPNGFFSKLIYRDDEYLLGPFKRLRQAARVGEVALTDADTPSFEMVCLFRVSNADADPGTRELPRKTLHNLPAQLPSRTCYDDHACHPSRGRMGRCFTAVSIGITNLFTPETPR